jgi:hypothetical protein
MKLYPVMQSEGTPYCLELRCVYGRPSFLYAPTSLMSSFLCVRLERVVCPLSHGLNNRWQFLYILTGKPERDEEGHREMACLSLGRETNSV